MLWWGMAAHSYSGCTNLDMGKTHGLTDSRTRMRRSWAMYMNVDASSNLVIPGQVLQQVRLLDPDPLVPSCRRTLDSSDFERAGGCRWMRKHSGHELRDAVGTVHQSPDRPQLQLSDTHSHSSRSGCSHKHRPSGQTWTRVRCLCKVLTIENTSLREVSRRTCRPER